MSTRRSTWRSRHEALGAAAPADSSDRWTPATPSATRCASSRSSRASSPIVVGDPGTDRRDRRPAWIAVRIPTRRRRGGHWKEHEFGWSGRPPYYVTGSNSQPQSFSPGPGVPFASARRPRTSWPSVSPAPVPARVRSSSARGTSPTPATSSGPATPRAVREHADGRQIALATFGPGDIFGELAMFDDERRSATVETIDPMEALAILGPDMRRLMLRRPQLAVALAGSLARRLRATNERLAQPVLPDGAVARGERDRRSSSSRPCPRARSPRRSRSRRRRPTSRCSRAPHASPLPGSWRRSNGRG